MRENASAMTSDFISSWRGYVDVRVQAAAAPRIAGDGRDDRRTARRRRSTAAYATPFPTRSTRRLTRSPGMAPDDEHDQPSARAIIRPPAAGFSIVSDSDVPGDEHRDDVVSSAPRTRQPQLDERDGRQPEALAHQPIDGGGVRPRERVRAHPDAKRRELLFRFARQRRTRLRRRALARAASSSSRIERGEPSHERLTRRRRARRAASRAPRRARARRDRAARRTSASSAPVARADVSRSSTRSRCDRQRGPSARGSPAVPSRLRRAGSTALPPAGPTARRHSSKTSSTSASQKSIRTGRRRGPFAIVALEVAIDAAAGDLERHALRRPAATRARTTARRRGSGARRSSGRDRLRSRGSNRSLQRPAFMVPFPHDSQPLQRQVADRRDSMSRVSGAMTGASPPVATQIASPPSSASSGEPAPRPCRRSRRTARTPSRRRSSGR